MFKTRKRLRIPPLFMMLLLGLLIPQVSLAGIPRPQTGFSHLTQWVKDTGEKTDVTLPTGLLLDATLHLAKDTKKTFRVAQSTVRQLDDEIFRLKKERDHRFSIVGPLVMTIIGGTLLIPGIAIFFGALSVIGATGGEFLATLFFVFSGIFLIPGLILFLIGLPSLIGRIKSRKSYDQRIRLLSQRRKAILGGRDPGPPPTGGPPPGGNEPPPGGPPPGGPPPEGSFSPLISFSF